MPQRAHMDRRFDVIAGENGVFAVSDFCIPFEIGRSSKAYAADVALFKTQLRKELCRMKPRDGEVLLARYAEEGGGGYDLENRLFYNIGASAFRSSAVNGLAFSRLIDIDTECRSFGAGRSKCIYSYSFIAPEAAESRLSGIEPVAEWNDVLLPLNGKSSPEKYWRALRSHMANAVASERPRRAVTGEFALVIKLGLTRRVTPANLVKPLVDGVVCAFHGEDERAVSSLKELFGLRGGDYRRYVGLSALLGEKGYIRSYGNGASFRWYPDDDRCAFALVTVKYGSAAPHFSGKLFEL